MIDKILSKLNFDKYFLLKIINTSLARGASAIGTFVFNFCLARYMDIGSFGAFMLAYSIIVGIGFFLRYGYATAIMRYVGIMFNNQEYGQIKSVNKDVTRVFFKFSTLAVALFILSIPLLGKYFFEGYDYFYMLIFLGISIPFFSYLTIQSSYFKAFKKPEIAPFFEIGLAVFFTGVFVAIVGLFTNEKVSLSATSISFFASSLMIFIFGSWYLKKMLNPANEKSVIELTPYDKDGFNKSLFDYGLSSITGYFLKFSPIIILGFFVSNKEVGLFSLSNSIAFGINFILWIVNTVYSPHFASLYANKKNEELNVLYKSCVKVLVLVSLPIFLIIVLFSHQILAFFGNEYTEAQFSLIILAVAQLINTVLGPVYFLLNMTGHQRELRNIVIFTAVFSILIGLILIPMYGFIGASISTAIGLVCQNIFAFYHSKKYLGIKIF